MARKGILLFCLISVVILTNAQERCFLPTGKTFWIQSAINYGKNQEGYWDIPGDPTVLKNNTNVAVWSFQNNTDRKFLLKADPVGKPGYYKVANKLRGSNCLCVSGAKTKTNGASLVTYECKNEEGQSYYFKYLGRGKFKIYNKSGLAVCLEKRSSKNGSDVRIWEDQNGPWMEWYLIDTKTKKAYRPDSQEQMPTFLINNYIEYKQQIRNKIYKKGYVSNVKYERPFVKVEVTLTQEREKSTDELQEVNKKTTVLLKYKDGIYYKRKYKNGRVNGYDQRTANKYMLKIVDGDENTFNYFTKGVAQSPIFFEKNKDKTFKYKENLAFVAGKSGIAKIKEISKNKIVLTVTATGINQSNGKKETKTFDYTINFKDGKYIVGSDDYPQTCNISTRSDGKQVFTVSGEQSSIDFTVQ